jgi:S1-C subfamily serine protease
VKTQLTAILFAISATCNAQLTATECDAGLVGLRSYGLFGCKCTGSGFWIDGTHVLTAAHVVEPATNALGVVTGDGVEHPAKVVSKGNSCCDYALVEVGRKVQHATLKLGKAISDGPVCSYGDFRVTGGSVEGGSGARSGTYIDGRPEFSVPSRPGMSGGPCVDTKGQVVGIVNMWVEDTAHAVVLPIEKVREALKW